MTNLYLQACSFFYMIMILCLYFGKDRIANKENKIFETMSIINIVGIILDLIIVYLSYVTPGILWLYILNKFYLLYIAIWAYLFVVYIFLITVQNKKVLKFHVIFSTIVTTICSLCIVALPIYLFNENNVMYTYGPSVTSMIVAAVILVVDVIIVIISNIKRILNKKYAPLFTLVGLGIVTLIVRDLEPGLLLTTSIMTFINILMYHTIENPDVKMLEQVSLAKDQAEQANKAKTDFLSSMSHEIRTPLNAIVGFSTVIDSAQTLDEAKENAKDIVEASNTLLDIVNGILDISKIEAGKLELVLKDYNPYELFEGCANLISIKMKEKGLDFQVNIAKDMPKIVYGDYANIKKIIVNLLSNAYKYTPSGTVKYDVSCVKNGNYCRIMVSVEDTGRGIKKEDVDKLFTKFQRLDEDRNTTIEGTGLGLAITKQLVEMMGGKIVCQSVYGSGSKFTVAIDQKITSLVDNKIAKSVNVASAPINVKGKKVLIVDDNKLNLKVAERLLRDFELDLTLIESGFECIDRINDQEKYDLILMDDMMPKMSGTETLQKLKQIKWFDIPVVALTANAISGMKEQYLNAGFDDYLAKPIEKEEMTRVLKKIFNTGGENEKIDFGALPRDFYEIDETDSPSLPEIEIPIDNKYQNDVVQEEIIEEVVEQKKIEYDINYLKENGIDVDHGIELLGDEEMYYETMQEFFKIVKERVLKIKELKANNDMGQYAVEVHALKSDSKYLGFTKLAELAYNHEMKSKENDREYINAHFTELLEEFKSVVIIIQKYLNK